jgi:cell division septal protein FtsQ
MTIIETPPHRRSPGTVTRAPGHPDAVVAIRTGPTIDPRLRQRWVDARRQEGRRRLRVLSALGALAVLSGAGLGVLHSPLVRVRHLRVAIARGSAGTNLTDSEVVAQAALGGQRLMIDVNGTRAAALIDQLPWAADARVIRQWPGTVRVTVKSRTAVAEVALSSPASSATASAKAGSVQVNPAPPGGVALVDATGRVLELDDDAPEGLPVLGSLAVPGAPGTWIAGTPGAASSGASVTKASSAEVLAAAAALPKALAAKIWTVEMGSQGLQLTVGTTVILFGDTTQLADKVTALGVIIDQVSLAGIATVDLRVPDRPALTPSSSNH